MNKLKSLIEETGYQKQMLAYESGMKASVFSKYINGRRKMDLDSLLAIRQTLLDHGVEQKEIDDAIADVCLLAEDIC